MQRIVDDLTKPEDHLALDEALLQSAENGDHHASHGAEAIRLWEFDQPVVVAGRSTRIDEEIDREYCQSRPIPILRRCSGGASIVAGPGCVMYSVVLSTESNPALRRIDVAHRYVIDRVLEAVRKQIPVAEWQGTCDVTVDGRKCSGNSLRIARRHLLYHGTLLYDFDLELVARCLRVAPRQPEYRRGRDHESFVVNVPVDPVQFSDDLSAAFVSSATTDASKFAERMRKLLIERYNNPAWHFRH